MPAPGLDDDLGLGPRPEPLQAQALVAELAVEAFRRAILPGLAGIDQRRIDAHVRDPGEQRARSELGAVVGTKIKRRPTIADATRQHLDHARRADAAVDLDGETFLGPFVGHRQALQLLPAGAPVEHEIVAPDLVRPRRRIRSRAAGGNPLLGRLRGTCSFACRHSRCARPKLIWWPSRPRKMRMRR